MINFKNKLFFVFWCIQTRDLEDLMYTAIVNNVPDFVTLFLQHGVHLEDFLTPERITKLYNEARIYALRHS